MPELIQPTISVTRSSEQSLCLALRTPVGRTPTWSGICKVWRMVDAALHTTLQEFNRSRLRPAVPDASVGEGFERELTRQIQHLRREHEFVASERAFVRRELAGVPTDAASFRVWFEDLKRTGPGQNDELFLWLAHEASLDEMKWFLAQEVAGEAGFDDLVALTQLQLPPRAKLELARNYWDEMGRGKAGGMHGPMLAHLARQMQLPNVPIVPEAVALGNLMMALGCNRSFAYQSLGALGVIELTAPGRAALVNAGLKRLGVSADVRRYYAIHATLDVEHSKAWNSEVLEPLVSNHPAFAALIAEGALMRLHAGRRCFESYRAFLWRQASDRAAE